MAVIYVKEQGAAVRKSGNRLVVSRKTETLLDIPVFQVDNLSVFGNVQLTTQALHMLLENGVDVSYFSRGGKYMGHSRAETSGNIFLRLEQYRFFMSQEKKLALSALIVRNKIENQLNVLKDHARRSTKDSEEKTYDWKADLKALRHLLELVPSKSSPDELRGLEGMASQIYFRGFSNMVKGDFRFSGRNRRPPRDPVNALLSLTYSFMTRELCSMLEAEGMEPHLGFCHGIRYGRKSLALDLIEEFRQPAGDRLVLLLMNKRMFTEEDFEIEETGGVTLCDESFKKFCTHYERWMTGRNSLAGEPSFRSAMKKQIGSFRRMLSKGEDYRPYCWDRQDRGDMKEECTEEAKDLTV